jgi:Asp-tRNA(Asn)/Glu-tRNA(Gln) amidotransferase A subunit family amidase
MTPAMTDPADLGTAEAARLIAAGELSSEALVSACLARIEAREPELRAWAFLDPDLALAAARAADARRAAGLAAGEAPGPLHGVPVGIKDIIDTADMPTENGFNGHKGRRPAADAACVAQLRAAGAVILGKTVTTELANRVARQTRNPVNPAHTPGGSSSGSAAAVGAGMVPAALGTQTGGSVIRPASYCGVHALKPTFGLISRVGIMPQSDPLDTIGTYGRSVEDVAYLADALTAPDPRDPDCRHTTRPALHREAMADPPRRPRLAFVKTPVWDQGEPRMQAALEDFAAALGGDCEEVALPAGMAAAWGWHHTCQYYGMARYYGPLSDYYGDRMSARLAQHVAEGREISTAAYRQAVADRETAYAALAPIFAGYDAILTPASPGPAPEGLISTGPATFNAFWTYCGTPCVSLPLLTVDGLPMGLQLVGPRGGDGALMRTARWLEARVGQDGAAPVPRAG